MLKLMHECLSNPGVLSDVYSRYYPYSFCNRILMTMQLAERGELAQPVATFKHWQSLGRQVRVRDEHGQPIKSDTGQNKSKLIGFTLRRGPFAHSDTDPIPGTDDKSLEPPASADAITLQFLRERLLTEELDVREAPHDDIDGNSQGYASRRTVHISPVAAYPLKTFLHEVSHVLHGHVNDPDAPTPSPIVPGLTPATGPTAGNIAAADSRSHRGIVEFQAEATAYLVLGALEVDGRITSTQWDPAASRGYVQHWLNGTGLTPTESEIRRCFTVADKILGALRPQTTTTTEDQS
jgi:hypothetical protein